MNKEILPKKQVIELDAYHPPTDGREDMLRLDFNENTIGCSPKVIKALKKITASQLSVYPEYGNFIKKIANHLGVNTDEILMTNGTDEAINLILGAFTNIGDEIIIPTPTFTMFRFYATLTGAKINEILYNEDLSFPFKRIMEQINEKTKIVVLVNPNNPTGTEITNEQIELILKKARENNAIVLVDEAYYEFFGKTSAGLVNKYDNLAVTRTFSKTFGLAGLRIGYILSNKNIIAILHKTISPYSVNAIALVCAAAALDDENFVKKYVAKVISERGRVSEEIKKMGVEVYPSKANFVLGKFGDACDNVHAELKKRKILVRNRTKDPLLKGCLRIGIGTRKQNDILLSALKEILSQSPKMEKIKVETILFDIDGVLVDVGNSYRKAIANTAEFFTKEKIKDSEIQSLKESTGFNNDWDLTEALIKKRNIKIDKQKIIDKFQEYYLGTKNTKGFIENETWLLDKKILKKLSEKYLVGIITGRPKEEAIIALNVAGVKDFFKIIIAMEDTAGNGKPNPLGINMAMKFLGNKNALYVGDAADDMRAAKNAGIIGIGCIPPGNKSNLKTILEELGARVVLNSVNEIMDVIE